MNAILKSGDFSLQLTVSGEPSSYSDDSELILTVEVRSTGFSGWTVMALPLSDFQKFVGDLSHLYEYLSGTAHLCEYYDDTNFLTFAADRHGHITVEGELVRENENGQSQHLCFENSADQSFWNDFCTQLREICRTCSR